MTTKNYRNMRMLETFDERLNYLFIGNGVCQETFGSLRYLNQRLYRSSEWKSFKNDIIIRDEGKDLGIIPTMGEMILVHHIVPITAQDILERNPCIFDMDNVICTTLRTHNMIHYGIINSSEPDFVERSMYDTCPWRC